MSKLITLMLMTGLSLLAIQANTTAKSLEKSAIHQADDKGNIVAKMHQMPLAFTQNQGQWDDHVLFRANAGGATMWFTPNGAYYQFTRRIPKADAAGTGTDAMADQMRLPEHERDSIETMMIKASFVGCNP